MAYSLPIAGYGQAPIGGNQSAVLQLIMQMIGQAQGGQAEARQANESRYNDILQQLADARGRSLGALDSLSGQEVTDANTSYDNKRNELLTDLADRGLGGWTKRIAVESMTKRERDAAVNRINDTLALNRNATDERFTDKTTGVMERRTDSYPDNSNLAGIIAQLTPLLSGAQGGMANSGGSPWDNLYGQAPPPQAWQQPQAPMSFPGTPTPTLAPADPEQAFRARIQQLNSQAVQDNSGLMETRRRDAMAGLASAMQSNGMDGDAQQKAALAYLQHMGWANYNPNTVSTAPFAPIPYQNSPTPYGGGYAPSYGRASPQPYYQGYGYGTGQNPAYRKQLAANSAASHRSLEEFLQSVNGVPSDAGTVAGGGFF